MNSTHVCPKGEESCSYMTLVVDDMNGFVLMKQDGQSVAFPRIDCPEMPHLGHLMSECFAQQLSRTTGIPLKLVLLYNTLTEMHHRHLQGTHRVVFECLDSYDAAKESLITPVCSDYKWVRISDLVFECKYDLSVGEDHLGVCTAVRTDEVEPSEGGVRPWQLVEWFRDTTKVATSILSDIGYNVSGEFEQYQISPVSAVLRVDTTKGRVYLKASHEREGRVVRSVAGFAPFVVPEPLYVNVEEGWMLMNDYGGQTLDDKFSREDYENVLMLHGRLQVESTKHLQELEGIGIPRKGFEVIMERTRKFLAEPNIREGLKKLGAAVGSGYEKIACEFFRELYAEGRLPIALVHHDLHDGNIIKTINERGQAQYVIFDWGFAEIDIAFVDVVGLGTVICLADRKNEENIDSYLQLWEEYGSVEELRQIRGCLYLSGMFQELLGHYEYAKENGVQPFLEKERMECLYGSFDQMTKEIEVLKRFHLQVNLRA